jgi:hypothetical protein
VLQQPVGRPTCGVVIEKSKGQDQEKICSEFAADQVTLVDPDDQTRVTAILLVCQKHSKELNDGKSLIFLSDNGVDHIGVRFAKKQ